MAYTKTLWNNNAVPAINADNLNKIEQGIADTTSTASQALLAALTAALASGTSFNPAALAASLNVTVEDVQAALETLFAPWWDDLTLEFSATKQGATLKPDFDYTNVGLLFPQNDPAEIIYGIKQLSHQIIPGLVGHPHIHWRQTGAAVPVWKLQYKWFDNGAIEPENWTELVSTTEVFSYTSGQLAQISSFPVINGSHITEVSSMFLVKIFRDDNVVTGDVLARQFDIHFQHRWRGSLNHYGD